MRSELMAALTTAMTIERQQNTIGLKSPVILNSQETSMFH